MDRLFSNKSSEGLSGAGKDNARGVAGVCDGARSPVPLQLEVKADKEEKDSVMCFYCKKRGHIVANCPVLKKQNAKVVVLVNKLDKKLDEPVMSKDNSGDLTDFVPFIMDGVVSLPGNNIKVPVKILRDTAASQSFILEGVLPFSNESAVGLDVPVLDFSMNVHSTFLWSWTLCQVKWPWGSIQVKGVAFLMGNELAKGKVLVMPEVTPVP